ncbi:MAG: hypothetical protein DMF00_00770 [Verrucomicrobia bacterium]|nr:MAG: hypothetical protein DMF00_00770 [Verrucomicrobiota bacterium]
MRRNFVDQSPYQVERAAVKGKGVFYVYKDEKAGVAYVGHKTNIWQRKSRPMPPGVHVEHGDRGHFGADSQNSIQNRMQFPY